MSGPKAKKPAAVSTVQPLRKKRPCPICKQPSDKAFHPFCSKRCADVDLNRWLGGAYAIPAVEPPDDFGDALETLVEDPEKAQH